MDYCNYYYCYLMILFWFILCFVTWLMAFMLVKYRFTSICFYCLTISMQVCICAFMMLILNTPMVCPRQNLKYARLLLPRVWKLGYSDSKVAVYMPCWTLEDSLAYFMLPPGSNFALLICSIGSWNSYLILKTNFVGH